jgi:rare lipoprotein A
MSVALTPIFAASTSVHRSHGSVKLPKAQYGLTSISPASASVSPPVSAAPVSASVPSAPQRLGIDPGVIISPEIGVTSAAQVVASQIEAPARLVVPTKNVTVVTPPPPPPPVASKTGVVSWYPSPAGTCASPSLPFGTIVTINDGWAQTTCRVDDRGPYIDGRILDLSPYSFSQIASLGTGIVWAKISW